MQLIPPPVEANPVAPAPSAFTFVEEDDVAFALGLCREVNRIYGDYHEGRLAASDQVLAGLMVTVEMLAALSRTVKDGMPGMRITVAAAQTREMLAVTFDQDPMQAPPPSVRRRHYRSVVAEGGRALPETRLRSTFGAGPGRGSGPVPGGWAARLEIGAGPSPSEPESRPTHVERSAFAPAAELFNPVAPCTPSPAGDTAPGRMTAGDEARYRPAGWRRLFRRRQA